MATIPLLQQSDAGQRNAFPASETSRSVLLGDGIAVRHLRSQIQRIAPYFRIALIWGEAGVGKQVIARAIHARSPGAQGRFIVADAGAFADQVGGGSAWSSADSLLNIAEGGTLYLRRTSGLSAVQQDALSRFFREHWERRTTDSSSDKYKAERRGSTAPAVRKSSIRILAASSRDLRGLGAVGAFRQDLYAQLSAVEIAVPPLRERLDDIPVLATWLLHWLADQTAEPAKHFSQETLAHLRQRRWHCNLRELEEVVAQAAAFAEGCQIEPHHLPTLGDPQPVALTPVAPPRVDRLNEVVLRHVLEVLNRCGGNKLRTAELLGISRSTLYRMLESNLGAISAFPG